MLEHEQIKAKIPAVNVEVEQFTVVIDPSGATRRKQKADVITTHRTKSDTKRYKAEGKADQAKRHNGNGKAKAKDRKQQ
jgi:hypothetical protein